MNILSEIDINEKKLFFFKLKKYLNFKLNTNIVNLNIKLNKKLNKKFNKKLNKKFNNNNNKIKIIIKEKNKNLLIYEKFVNSKNLKIKE